jgi:Fe-S-cluster containining protein
MACGMCCGGALFNSLSLEPHEFERAIMSGLRVDSDPDNGFCLTFPCPALDGAACQIYADRPDGCSAFRCETLKALDSSEITLAEGLSRVAVALPLWRAAETAIAPETIPGYRTRRAAALQRGEALADDGARAAINALDGVLDRHFRLHWRRQRDAFAAVEGRPPDAA